ncbi:hypothetical protein F4861DRAFT_537417 [Xylaria intraflava]|nr:hypothetical protein F4861DRAFT_537417 [Xylaria intraflava]
MDDFLFDFNVKACKVVVEDTHYLEIFNYTDKSFNSCEDHPLASDEFEDFLDRRGVFEPPKLKNGVQMVDGIRLVIQRDAKQIDIFSPNVLSLPHAQYRSMVRKMHLPFQAIEDSSAIGTGFWCEYDGDEDDRHLHIIFRKSHVRQKGETHDWEIILSYSFNTAITTGFVKGTKYSHVNEAIRHLAKASYRGVVGHPMLLPIIILSHDLAVKIDIPQRDARVLLRRLENSISLHREIEEEEELYADLEHESYNLSLSQGLNECRSQVLWDRPQAYQEIVKEMQTAMEKFKAFAPPKDSNETKALHESIGFRLEFFRAKLSSQEHYMRTTLERLAIQRQSLDNTIASKTTRLNLEITIQQGKFARRVERDGAIIRTLPLLGAIFIPGIFLSSVLSITFFNFKVAENRLVSQELWIYFVITIPLTLTIVRIWWVIDRRRQKIYAIDLEQGIQEMKKRHSEYKLPPPASARLA